MSLGPDCNFMKIFLLKKSLNSLLRVTAMKINLLQASTAASTFFVFPTHFVNSRNYFSQVSSLVPF